MLNSLFSGVLFINLSSFTLALAGGLSMESEWKIVFSILQESSNLNNAVVWMVLLLPLLSNTSSFFPTFWGIIPSVRTSHKIQVFVYFLLFHFVVSSLPSRILRLHICWGVRLLPISVLNMTLNNLMVRFQLCWSFGECRVSLYCHCFQVHSGLEWVK